jgi:hypothetical protein
MMHLMKHLQLFVLLSFGFHASSFEGVEIGILIAIGAKRLRFWEMVFLASAREMWSATLILTKAKPC